MSTVHSPFTPLRLRAAALAGAALLLALGLAVPGPGALAGTVYEVPPQELSDLVDAPPTPFFSVSPTKEWMLIMERPNLPAIDELAAPELRLAGLRIRPGNNGPSRQRGMIEKLILKRMEDASERVIEGIPPGANINYVRWSPDGKMIAFTVFEDTRIELWVAEVEKERTRRVLRQPLNAAGGRPYRWLSDSRTFVCTIIPEDREPAPAAPTVPSGPVIQENIGKEAPARTYQDLLENPHDENLFDHYFTSQLIRVDVKGNRKRLGDPAVIMDFSASPDGNYVLVESVHRPYSYLVPHSRFPRRMEVWDRDGKLVREIVDLPLMEEVPTAFGSVPTGPRSFGWRSDAPAVVHWTEAQDGGDTRVEAEIRDRVYTLAAPFEGAARPLINLGQRYGGLEWGTDEVAVVYSWWWKTRNVKTWRVRPGTPDADPALLFDHSWEDRYGDPGDFVTTDNEQGQDVLLTGPDGQTLFLSGDGASPEGNRPFVDRFDLQSGETTRLWRSEAPHYERAVTLMDRTGQRLITRRESKEEPPNYFLRDLASGDLTPLTEFPHPHPQLSGLQKELIKYEREDGVQLTGTLYLPPDYDPASGPLPMLMWAYPQEFKSADAAGQVTDSPYQFDRTGWWSPLVWLTQGYAVLDDPKLPIVGEGDEEPNDSFVKQLVMGAQAAVDEVVRRGVADRDHIAIGGHSYGAFMTANLFAHSDIFRAGVARSGAYNRTLTPFGFQAEERTLWQASEVYFTMSPFMHAEKVNEPILLIHGDSDNNSGTYPMQSERYYSALKGLGATTRLVMLPHESHGYRARESVLHMLWETRRWLEEYVKNAGPRASSEETPSSSEAR